VELFEALAGDLLSQLGYEREFEDVSPPVQAVAAGYRAAWESELHERGKLTPVPVPDT
jgi:hypothetical protein